MDFPLEQMPPPPILTPFHYESIGEGQANVSLDTTGSGAWPVNNHAWFYPFRLTGWATAYQFLFMVGATSSGDIDVGIYDSQKNLIVSAGSTAMSASTNALQEINIADTVLAPGDYLIAASCSSSTGTAFRTSVADEQVLSRQPIYEQALGSVTLPDPCTPVLSTQVNVVVVVIGVQLRSVF